MREQEQKFPAAKRESRAAFLVHMRRTALGLPAAQLIAAIGDMKRHCTRLLAAKGGNIEEGGKGDA